MKRIITLVLLVITMLLSNLGIAGAENKKGPIVIQGALKIEILYLIDQLTDAKTVSYGPYEFYEGKLDGQQIVISKTMPGAANAAVATYIAIDKYNPSVIINQGLIGGYTNGLNVYDIVVANNVVNVGAVKTPLRGVGQGSNSLEWEALQLTENGLSTGKGDAALFESDKIWVDTAMKTAGEYKRGNVVKGTLACSDMWNNEHDRIQNFRKKYNAVAEEMEGAAAAEVCKNFKVPFLSVGLVASNVMNNSTYQRGSGVACQAFVLNVVQNYIKNNK